MTMKNILVIGGSYFTGRVYSILASKEECLRLHVVNRGTYPLNLPNVTEYRCDRHDAERLAETLPEMVFDAAIDFCAYMPGETETIAKALDGRIGHYVFFSTASVYRPAKGFLNESAQLLHSFGSDETGRYLAGKAALEDEVRKTGLPWTILRPAFIYGPYNYAPREAWFIEQIVRGRAVPFPEDAAGRWSFVYVADIAKVLIAIAGDKRAFGKNYNLAGKETVDYSLLMEQLERCWGKPVQKQTMTCRQADSAGIPLPFPLDGDVLYDGSRVVCDFGVGYTPLQFGMEKTFGAFRSVFEKN